MFSRMKSPLSTPLLLGLLLAAGALASCQEPARFRVMAYNVKHGRGMDGQVDLERTARVIEEQAPDLVTLQEIDAGCQRSGSVDQALWLGERLGMNSVFGAFMDYDGGEYGMALLARPELLESINHRLPDGPEPRTALAARVELEPGRELMLVCVHLYGDEQERLEQAEAMLAALADEACPVVLAGDFNSRPGSVVMNRIEEEFTNIDKGEDRLTFSSVEPRIEIDFVLVRPVEAFRGSALDVLEEPHASDHRPLIFDSALAER